MGVGNRAATCASCGKRLNRKQWYYRNGKYFCKQHCFVTEQGKAEQEAAKAEAGNAQAPKAEAPKAAEIETPKNDTPKTKTAPAAS